MLRKFEKILVALKVPKYDAFSLQSLTSDSVSEFQTFLSKFQLAKLQHETKSQAFLQSLKAQNKRFDVLKITEVASPIKDYDLVVTLGGDGTFLRTASFINDDTPIMGINTDSQRSYCTFCSYNPKVVELEPDSVWQRVFNGDFKIKKRTRIKITTLKPNPVIDGKSHPLENFCALNEIFFADKDVGKTSNFRMSINDQDYFNYRSGGVIVATGSGSTAWIKSARNIGVEAVRDIIGAREGRNISQEEAQDIAYKADSKYILAPEDKELLFLVREPIMQKPEDYLDKAYIGKAKRIKIQSELKQGVIIIDGNFTMDLGFGQVAHLDASQKDLNCICLCSH